VPCIGDQEACLNEFFHGGHPQCAVNPRTGFEERWSRELPPAASPRRVAVVGAGPAGVTAACVAAARGHHVTLLERRDRPGGMLMAGAVPRIKFDVANYLAYLESWLQRCSEAHELEVALGTEATVDSLRARAFDAVVLCTGGRPAAPPVDGIDLPHVIQAVDLLLDPGLADGAERVIVVGGGDVGCETAHFLANELGKGVTVIEMLPHFMEASCTANRGYLIHYLERQGVALWNCTRLQRVEQGRVVVLRNLSGTVPSPYVTWQPVLPKNIVNPLARPIKVDEREVTLEADLVVLATGLVPDDGLYHACQREGVAPEIHNAGDSFSPATIAQATKAGYVLGRSL
jgi:2-enoate reductase